MSLLLQQKYSANQSNSLSQQKNLYKEKLSPKATKVLSGEGTWKIPSFPGSLTLEASLALTLFLLFVISLCQLFLVMQLQLRIQKDLEQVSGEAAQYSYISSQVTLWDSKSRLVGKIEDYLLTELSEEALRLRFISVSAEEYLDQSLVEGGAGGVSFHESSILDDGHRIRLVVSYRVSLPFSVLGFGSIEFRQQSYRYAWLGDTDPQEKTEQDEQMVYVTKDSQVYHLTLSCTYLKLSVRSVTLPSVDGLRNENGAKYYPCELCRPAGTENIVYITGDGIRYHSHRDCGGISRNVTSIPISQVGDRRPCSRCGQGT